ncbi:MAG: NACHT domain-containing protein [Chloroflexi bacterium]|nr:NACHT domain-containing protein [Chloroflexota bacterium]
MTHPIAIRIIETDNNRRGDLLTRLIRDLLHALGYHQLRLNVHKAGRELDVLGQHRLEPVRFVRAECKATAERVGGDQINKFLGAVDAERRQLMQTFGSDTTVAGYFVSLSGFKDSALEQEAGLRPSRVALLDGEGVVKELISGRMIVAPEHAVHEASRCVPAKSGLELHSMEVLVHDIGLLWALYYHRNRKPTHFALIHADGHPLSHSLVTTVIRYAERADARTRLGSLIYLAPPEDGPSEAEVQEARAQYFAYLEAACGRIQLDGLPADEQVGSKRLRLESLFVPLHVVKVSPESDVTMGYGEGKTALAYYSVAASASSLDLSPVNAYLPHRAGVLVQRLGRAGRTESGQHDLLRRPVGKAMGESSRLALLAPPGGGKSVLLNRLAVAYAFPERRAASDDTLPEREWLPILVRCRDLGSLVRQPMLRIIKGVAERANLEPRLHDAFATLVSRELRRGEALLLIDGLDEIADDGDRAAFAGELRNFLGIYPAASAVVTSREAGFRAVAGAVSAECETFHLADFDDQDLRCLVRLWHRQVYGDDPTSSAAADALAETIVANDRIRLLASNPLLLTTLLLVKRWVGQLPTKRTVLYDKAIEVLLMTWNVQAHEPIPLDEALPRLEYIAFSMMKEGSKTLTEQRLRALLRDARRDLPELLGYSRISESEFVDRVELRSSLLAQSGHTLESGRLVPAYQFRHLTFQEYLAARAVVDGNYPGRTDSDTPVTVLLPHLGEEGWREVVPLTAVLAGREARGIVAEVIRRASAVTFARSANLSQTTWDSSQDTWQDILRQDRLGTLLGQCLLDEVQLAPAEIEQALQAVLIIRFWDHDWPATLRKLARGKFAHALRIVAERGLKSCDEHARDFAFALGILTACRLGWSEGDLVAGMVDLAPARSLLLSTDPVERASGALVLTELPPAADVKDIPGWETVAQPLAALLASEHPFVQYSAALSIGRLGDQRNWLPPNYSEALLRLARLLAKRQNIRLQSASAEAICKLPVLPRTLVRFSEEREELIPIVEALLTSPAGRFGAALVLAYYLQAPLSDAELIERASSTQGGWAGLIAGDLKCRFGILENLGEAGMRAARQLRDADSRNA